MQDGVAGMDGGWLAPLLTREIPFGKHKGMVLADLPVNYLQWFARVGFLKCEIGQLLALMREIDHKRPAPTTGAAAQMSSAALTRGFFTS